MKILIPFEKIYSIRKGKKYKRKRNFFPGYILLYANLFHGKTYHIIKNIPGVLGFLTSKNLKNNSKLPQPIRKCEIDQILKKIDKNKEEKITDFPFLINEIIKVVEGPFIGFKGNIQKIFKERKKVIVMLRIFGRNTPIELNYIQIEKVL